jgi:hypothetical protein
MVANGAVVASDEIATAGESNGEPVEEPAEVTRPVKERERAVGQVAVGPVLANVYHDPKRHTVTLLLDERHAIAVIYAVRVLAADYEAHAREVRTVVATMPRGSYGAANRHFTAIRHERLHPGYEEWSRTIGRRSARAGCRLISPRDGPGERELSRQPDSLAAAAPG